MRGTSTLAREQAERNSRAKESAARSRERRARTEGHDQPRRPGDARPAHVVPARDGRGAVGEADMQRGTPRDSHRLGEVLAERIGPRRYELWFGPAATRLHVDGARVRVDAVSQYVADWIGRHFAEDLAHAARAALGESATVSMCVAPNSFVRAVEGELGAVASPQAPGTDRGQDSDSRSPQRRRGSGPRRPTLRRLEEFVAGPSNQLALDAGQRVAEDSGGAPSLLFVHGDCGVGKTHLLQGICERRRTLCPRQQIRYTTAEQFTNEYLAALRSGSLDGFRSSLRRLDLLAIDDIHFLTSKTATQSEFLHTMDAIDLSGARIVLASDEHPRAIRKFSQQLISRFLSGMVVRVDRPDRETRVRLVQGLARARGVDLQPAAVEAIANRCVGSVREIEGALARVVAFAQLAAAAGPSPAGAAPVGAGSSLAVGALVVEQALAPEGGRPSGPVRVADIVAAVCRRLGVERDDLVGSGRARRAVLARSLAVHLARDLTTQSFPEIARALGRDGHSTVHTAAKRIEQMIADREEVEWGDATLAGHNGRAPLSEVLAQLRHDVLRGASRGGPATHP